MKVINKFMFLLLASVIFVSCEGKGSKENLKGSLPESGSETVSEEMRTVEIDISGMTCEIGCAKLIQSKLYKTEGVSFAEVRFTDSTGVVSFDANLLNENDLRKVVEAAGGGDLYRVRSISEIKIPDNEAESLENAQ